MLHQLAEHHKFFGAVCDVLYVIRLPSRIEELISPYHTRYELLNLVNRCNIMQEPLWPLGIRAFAHALQFANGPATTVSINISRRLFLPSTPILFALPGSGAITTCLWPHQHVACLITIPSDRAAEIQHISYVHAISEHLGDLQHASSRRPRRREPYHDIDLQAHKSIHLVARTL